MPLSIAVCRPSNAQSAGHRDEYGRAGTRAFDLVGMALAAKLDDAPYRVFTLLGDGELAEGSNWEAAMAAARITSSTISRPFSTITTLQITGRTRDVCSNEPIDEKFRAFGWTVRTIDWP